MFWLSRDEVRELDRRAIEGFGVPGVVLMENAGRGCAELLMRLNPERQPVVILCGPGNNGGDGFVIARHLDNRGRSGIGTTLDVQLEIAALHLELGDVLFYEEFDQFFEFFLVHRIPITVAMA